MTRLLITGGGGYLGRHLVPLASPLFETSYTYFSQNPRHASSAAFALDVRDETAVANLVQQLQPQVIIHTVGSNHGPDVTNVILSGTRHIMTAAQNAGSRLVHLSTDVIFDGRDGPYSEEDHPAPIHEYGRAKAAAERIVVAHPDHAIIRTSLIYSLQHMDSSTKWLVGALSAGRAVTLFSDQRRNPVWADSLSRACLELASGDYRGILNVAGEQVLTRAEFGLRMLDWWGIMDRQTLAIGPSDHDRWPADCTLDLQRAAAILKTSLPGVDTVLKKHQGDVIF